MKHNKEYKMIRNILTILMTIALIGTITNAFATLDREVQLKAQTNVMSNEICLDQLTDADWVKGRCYLDKKNCCRWKIENGATSAEFKRLDLQRELDKTDFGGIKIKLQANADSKNDSILIKQTHREVSADEIRLTLKKEIEEKFPQAELRNISSPAQVFVSLHDSSAQNSKITFELPENITSKNYAKIIDPATLETLGVVNFSISQFITAYVAKKTVHPMKTIDITNFELKKIETSAGNTSYFDKESFPIGVRARVTIRAGQPLAATQIERTPIVKLGDVVTLVLKSDNLKISTKGVVQSSASVGDTVTVQLPRYNRTFRGKLQEARTVEVWF